MTGNENNLIWIDLEMTGLDPERDRIIEIATLVTDANLNIMAEGPVIAVHQSDEQLALMDEWNVRTHTGSGLVERVKASRQDDRAAELETIAFLQQWVPAGKSPICGNSVGQDPPFPVPLHAGAGGLLPLSLSGRQHVEGTGAPLEAGNSRRL
jgi:Oligoribonuclease (3'->5' exoribonuclease)